MQKIKICGLRYPVNIKSISQLPVHYLGFIFYPKSPRYVGVNMDPVVLQNIPQHLKKVGVFVNEEAESLLAIKDRYGLDLLQLHGEESPQLCGKLKKSGVRIIKAFQVDEHFDFKILEDYAEVVEYFLFDTSSKQYGGSGKKFNWQMLENYDGMVPFFLSGGIGPGDVKAILEFQHPMLHALDLNSGFEDCPALKNVGHLQCFTEKIGH
ncbi:MAG: phosphoribosylanthranilate isomerase [Marinifilaceae bacterium]